MTTTSDSGPPVPPDGGPPAGRPEQQTEPLRPLYQVMVVRDDRATRTTAATERRRPYVEHRPVPLVDARLTEPVAVAGILRGVADELDPPLQHDLAVQDYVDGRQRVDPRSYGDVAAGTVPGWDTEPLHCPACRHAAVVRGACTRCGWGLWQRTADERCTPHEINLVPSWDPEPAFVPPAAEQLPAGALDTAAVGASALSGYAQTRHGRNLLAHALAALTREGYLHDRERPDDLDDDARRAFLNLVERGCDYDCPGVAHIWARRRNAWYCPGNGSPDVAGIEPVAHPHTDGGAPV